MISTEKKHWVNDHQIRGGWYHTLTLSAFSYGVLFAWGSRDAISLTFYKLI